jgi:hypothetical protein
MIGKLLGHTQVQTTARYAHLANDPVKQAAERVADQLGTLLLKSRHPEAGAPSETPSHPKMVASRDAPLPPQQS